MKQYRSRPRYMAHVYRRQRAAEKHKRRRARGGPHRHFFRRPAEDIYRSPISIVAPNNFSFVKNTDEFTQFLATLKGIGLKGRAAFVDLSNVHSMSPDGIAVFVSQIARYPGHSISGNVPVNTKMNEIFRRSGIYDFVKSESVNASDSRADRGLIRQRGSRKVQSEIGKELIHFATGSIHGQPHSCPGVQTVLLECMANTNNHAGRSGQLEKWWATVYADTGTAAFTFVDCGIGIFESVQVRKLRQKIKKLARLSNNATLLEEILHNRIQSSTGLSYRGKGLPSIFLAMQRGTIHNLAVIANDARGLVSNSSFTMLKTPFQGTVVYWEIK